MKNLIGNITTAWSSPLDALGSVVNARLLMTNSTHLGKLASARKRKRKGKTKISTKYNSSKQINILKVGSKFQTSDDGSFVCSARETTASISIAVTVVN